MYVPSPTFEAASYHSYIESPPNKDSFLQPLTATFTIGYSQSFKRHVKLKHAIDSYLNYEAPKAPNMLPVINQADIPTLPILYHTKRITINETPLAAPSADLNAKVGLIRTDITRLHLPNGAIVNAANENLTAGAGVCGAIHAAAGPELGDACHRSGRCETGYAKATRAYRLPCKRIIHAVGPIYWLAKETNEHTTKLASCYTETLKLAVSHGLTAVAFCALSTGIYGYPSYEAAETAIAAVRRFLESEDGKKLELVIFCNFEKKDEVAYSKLISIYFPPTELESEAEGTAEVDKIADPAEPTDLATAGPIKPKPTEPALSDKPEKDPKEEAAPTEEPKPKESVPMNLTEPDEADEADDFVLIDKDNGPETNPK